MCLNIQRIKLCMAENITVVLVHSEALFESLYDLLNQHYTEYGGNRYVRLAFGTSVYDLRNRFLFRHFVFVFFFLFRRFAFDFIHRASGVPHTVTGEGMARVTTIESTVSGAPGLSHRRRRGEDRGTHTDEAPARVSIT